MSSIFLEPVSLGNYCIIVVAFVCARFRDLSFWTVAFLGLGTVLLLIGCDGRLAAMSSLAIIIVTTVATLLPPRTPLLYLPATVLLAYVIVTIGDLRAGSDDFSGRIAHTVELLSSYDLSEYLGASNEYLKKAVDSGLAYLITTQSLAGLIAIWLVIVFASSENGPDKLRFTHAIAVYLSLTMIVSFGFLSIKTAALLWFIHGSLQAQPGRRLPYPKRAPRPAFQPIAGAAA